MKKIGIFLLSLIFLGACSKQVEPIRYGEDICTYCSMTIVDKGHASQLVTDKGKNYKFDATECMIKYLEEQKNEEQMWRILSADYLHPGALIEAQTAFFVISEDINSPMGASLITLEKEEEADQIKKEIGGEIYDWDNVKKEVKQLEIYTHGEENLQGKHDHSMH